MGAATFTSGDEATDTGEVEVESGEPESDVGSTSGEEDMQVAGICGDGVLDFNEECDDGNDFDADACTNTCESARCGDGIVSVLMGESCDDGDLDNQDGCDADCQPSAFVQVSLGRSHSCAVNRVGELWCWGSNAYGQLGHGILDSLGDDEAAASWGPVPLGEKVRQVSAGALHTCALLEDGHQVRCWGSGGDGRLGGASEQTIGDDESAAESVSFSFAQEVAQLEAGRVHSCVRTVSGEVYCWGRADGAGLGVPGSENIGDDELATFASAVDLAGPAVDLSVDDHACAVVELDGVGVLRCWGTSDQGELGTGENAVVYIGDDETPGSQEPVRLGFTAHVHAGRAGVDNSCAIVDEQVRCWGDGYWGVNANATIDDIGDDEYPYVSPPGVLLPGEYALDVELGEFNACALLDNHRVRCWGRDETALLGYELLAEDIGDDEYGYVAPAHQLGSLDAGGQVVSLAVGDHHACVVTQAGQLRCWGANDSGQLGYGDTEARGDAPGELEGLPDLPLLAP